MFDDLFFVDLVVVDLVLCWLKFIVLFVVFLHDLILIFSVLTYLVSSGMLNLNAIDVYGRFWQVSSKNCSFSCCEVSIA